MVDDRFDAFAVCISVDGPRVTATVDGEVDSITAPSLAGVLAGLIDAGHRDLVVDLGAITFLDARGVSVLATTAGRATSAGATLTLRSVSVTIRRILDITRVSELLAFDNAISAPSELGAEQTEDDRTTHGEAGDQSMAAPSGRGLVRSSTDVIDAALRLVTALAGATIHHADGVSVTLERHGQLMTVAATDDTVYTMDRHQYETGEGPCLSAKAEGRWFYVESVEDETRWPAFVPLALEGGIRSVLASPLVIHDHPQGSLNIYSNTRQAFGTREQELAALFADEASQILTSAGQELTDEETSLRFVKALTARQTIHQAQGVLMVRNDLSANDAIGSLFREARAADVTVLARASEILSSMHPVDGDG